MFGGDITRAERSNTLLVCAVSQSLKPSSDTQNTLMRAGSWGTPRVTRLRGFPGSRAGSLLPLLAAGTALGLSSRTTSPGVRLSLEKECLGWGEHRHVGLRPAGGSRGL